MNLFRRCLFVVLCVTAVNAQTQCPKGNNEIPGGEIALPFPPDKCVVPTEDFLKYAVDRVYVSAYTINTMRLIPVSLPSVGLQLYQMAVLWGHYHMPRPEPRDFRVLSGSPADYLITYYCWDVTEIVCGKCPDLTAVIYIRDRREDTDGDGIPDGVPDFTGVPWCDINKFSKHCLGEEFENDDLLGWEWKGRSQPENCTLLTP